jgi:enterobactin synthetase component D / holo-[acyl-carrier protein] synthase
LRDRGSGPPLGDGDNCLPVPHGGLSTAEWLKIALGPSIAVSERRTAGDPGELLPNEAALMSRALPRRVLEFAGGRACAREALAVLGGAGPILVGPGRAPQWPAGFVGSITHTEGYCAAVAGRSSQWAGLGIDAEILTDVGDDLEAQILKPREQMAASRLPAAERQSTRAIIFSAKEAFFKCQFPITNLWLDFKDVSVALGNGRFEVHLDREVAQLARWPRPAGSYAVFDNLILTAIGLVRPPSGP